MITSCYRSTLYRSLLFGIRTWTDGAAILITQLAGTFNEFGCVTSGTITLFGLLGILDDGSRDLMRPDDCPCDGASKRRGPRIPVAWKDVRQPFRGGDTRFCSVLGSYYFRRDSYFIAGMRSRSYKSLPVYPQSGSCKQVFSTP